MSDSLAKRLCEREGVLRSDLVLLDQVRVLERRSLYVDEDNSIDSEDHDRRMRLFWHVWMPEVLELEQAEPVLPATILPDDHELVLGSESVLPQDIESEYLQRLERLELAHRWVYDDGNQAIADARYEGFSEAVLLDYQHVAAARAFALMRRDGYSDDVRDSLHRGWWAGYQFEHPRFLEDPFLQEQGRKYGYDWAERMTDFKGEERFWSDEKPPQYLVSSWLVSALVLLELARVSRKDLQFEQAFNLYADAAERVDRAVPMLDERFESNRWQIADENEEPVEVIDSRIAEWRSLVRRRISRFRLETEEFTSVVEQLLFPGDGETRTHFAEVAKKCGHMADMRVNDVHFDGRVWSTDWHEASSAWRRLQGRAEERMSPMELRQLRDEEAQAAAEKRLRTYFFAGYLWDELEERAQQHLITADLTWFSPRGGAVQSALGTLQVAVESVCYPVVWGTLRTGPPQECAKDHKLGASYRRFLDADSRLTHDKRSPDLGDFEWAVRLPCYRALIDERRHQLGHFTEWDPFEFLTHALPVALKRLSDSRNPATHDYTKHWERDEVTAIMGLFLGIGQPGILPKLLEIKRRLAPADALRKPTIPR